MFGILNRQFSVYAYLLCFLAWGLLFESQVNARQQESRRILESKVGFPVMEKMITSVMIPQPASNKCIVRTINGFRLSDPAKVIGVLSIGEAATELGVSSGRMFRLQKSLDASAKLRREVSKRAFMISRKDSMTEFIGWYEIEAKGIAEEIRSALSPRLKRVVGAASEQITLRRIGLDSYLASLEREGVVSLSHEEKKRLEVASNKELKRISTLGKELVKASLDELLLELTKSKRSEIDVKALVGDGIQSVDLLVAQLAYTPGAIRNVSSEFELLSRPAIYLAGEDGSPRFYVRSRQVEVPCDFERMRGYESLLELIVDGGLKGIELTEMQIGEIDAIRREVVVKTIEWDLYLTSASNPWIASENVIDMQDVMCDRVLEQLVTTLDDSQIAVIKQRIAARSAGRFGLVYELTQGYLKDRLKISAGESRRLKAVSPKIRTKIISKCREWADGYNRELISNLDPANRSAVEARLGPCVDFGGAALFVLAFEREG